MPIRTVQTATCDRPGCPAPNIDMISAYVDAETYGVVFHRDCWESMTGPELAKTLGLDDIRWAYDGSRGSKVIYSKEPS